MVTHRHWYWYLSASGVGFGMEDQPTTPRKSQSISTFIDGKLRGDLGCRNFLLRTEASIMP
jgi:hypothetical protein